MMKTNIFILKYMIYYALSISDDLNVVYFTRHIAAIGILFLMFQASWA